MYTAEKHRCSARLVLEFFLDLAGITLQEDVWNLAICKKSQGDFQNCFSALGPSPQPPRLVLVGCAVRGPSLLVHFLQSLLFETDPAHPLRGSGVAFFSIDCLV